MHPHTTSPLRADRGKCSRFSLFAAMACGHTALFVEQAHFLRMIPQTLPCPFPVDTSTDSDCVHQLILTAHTHMHKTSNIADVTSGNYALITNYLCMWYSQCCSQNLCVPFLSAIRTGYSHSQASFTGCERMFTNCLSIA